jgi:hypothetical protein
MFEYLLDPLLRFLLVVLPDPICLPTLRAVVKVADAVRWLFTSP